MPHRALALAALILAACAPAAPRPSSPPAPGFDVAITVDDLPLHGPSFPGLDRLALGTRFTEVFRAHRVPPVVGFVNGTRLEKDQALEGVLRQWVSSGNRLGNHTYSHPKLNDTALPDYLADLDRGQSTVDRFDPRATRLFRFPFLSTGDTVEKQQGVRAHLRAANVAIAEVTIDADDWAYNAPFARCAERGNTGALAEVRQAFVDAHVSELRRMRAAAQQLEGREIEHVLLLHLGAADADALDALLTAFEREGARFVTLETALADPFYARDPGPPHSFGGAYPYVLAKARGVKLAGPSRGDAEAHERWLEGLCR